MIFMQWDPNFELGIHEFDEHHKHLVDLINLAFDGFAYKAERDEIEAVLDELSDYATYHFAAEEQWMEAHQYPALPRHREEHQRFCDRVAEIRGEFRRGEAHLSLEVLQFLHSWLTNHILKTDADYGRFARELPHG